MGLLNKQEVKKLLKGKLIAVIRGEDLEEAKLICKTIIESGITTLEITFSLPRAEKLIKELKNEMPHALIGAGTVLNKGQAELAVANGADFIVSPCIVKEVGDYCKEKDVFCSMGAATPTEAYDSYLAGSDVVKLFPGDCLSMKMIKGIKAPMPFIEMMPTGGVDDKNVKEWFESGAYAIGFGGYLTKGINSSNLGLLKERCKILINAAK
ncbi:bifunctional 4-hydroxy-2-oxoglutarate aldolase/2-dehydro-3-deoxy-phosphogluconate aldolase [Clostridium nigeriense]|uniref:bifunctional 4-hydroxy-2-oxoglutarate aldolase/2-dehydro-3-deoxy-phosphogluconate aldolase n=1 Tax=Clostridium nigeriense TaxID=1805470 RepID=UPI001F170ACD|nr:bifunctional 4-hydroxy-2-oxoglutarate aldolase/2-dehydro-3-deoxy-phosphogluconate aldolase [Clostridium nigeriense]